MNDIAEVVTTPYVHEAQEQENTQLAVHSGLLWGSASPSEILSQATEVANVLADVVEKQQLFTMIRDKKHVRVEGWTFLGSVLNTIPICRWTKPIMQIIPGKVLGEPDTIKQVVWEARVEAVRNGVVIGAAEAQCLKEEARWATAEDYAVRSMAQTRATVKALRMPLGFIVALRGYATTPAEEMDGVDLTDALERSIEAVRAKKEEAQRAKEANLSEGTREVLEIARRNREKEQAKLDARPTDRQKLENAGLIDPEELSATKCKKCGARIQRYTAKAGHQFDQCEAARKSEAIYKEGGHHYRKLG